MVLVSAGPYATKTLSKCSTLASSGKRCSDGAKEAISWEQALLLDQILMSQLLVLFKVMLTQSLTLQPSMAII